MHLIIFLGLLGLSPLLSADVIKNVNMDARWTCDDVSHEGMVRYNPTQGDFEVCRNHATGWEILAPGAGGSGGGGVLTATRTSDGAKFKFIAKEGDTWLFLNSTGSVVEQCVATNLERQITYFLGRDCTGAPMVSRGFQGEPEFECGIDTRLFCADADHTFVFNRSDGRASNSFSRSRLDASGNCLNTSSNINRYSYTAVNELFCGISWSDCTLAFE